MTANAGMSIVCERCGKAFHVKPSRLKRYNTRFCSRVCRTLSSDPVYFWSHVDIRGADECWPWRAGTRVRDYGGAWFGGKNRLAHQVAFQFTHGFYAPYLRHSCDNESCCNPAHLLEGTHADNMADSAERGLHPHGERSLKAKLIEEDVREIRADPRTLAEIAADYGVHPAHVSRIKGRKTWRHLL